MVFISFITWKEYIHLDKSDASGNITGKKKKNQKVVREVLLKDKDIFFNFVTMKELLTNCSVNSELTKRVICFELKFYFVLVYSIHIFL